MNRRLYMEIILKNYSFPRLGFVCGRCCCCCDWWWFDIHIRSCGHFQWPAIKSWKCNNQFHVSFHRHCAWPIVNAYGWNHGALNASGSAWLLMWQFVSTKYLLISPSFPFLSKYSERCFSNNSNQVLCTTTQHSTSHITHRTSFRITTIISNFYFLHFSLFIFIAYDVCMCSYVEKFEAKQKMKWLLCWHDFSTHTLKPGTIQF